MERLTVREEEIMQVLWKLGKAFVKEIIAELPDPKPPYTTVSSVVRLLEEKGFVGYTAFGRTHQYFPLVDQKEYAGSTFQRMVQDYFQGSYKNVVSFMMNAEEISDTELAELRKLLEKGGQNDA